MDIKQITTVQLQNELTDRLTHVMANAITYGLTYLEKSLLATVRSKLGYEMSFCEEDKEQMFKVLQRLDPHQYKKYCISSRSETSDLMVEPLRNNITYITSINGINTWILVSTRSWNANDVGYVTSDELNIFIFGVCAHIIHQALLTKFSPSQICITACDEDGEKVPYIKTYRMSVSKNKEDGYIDYAGVKQVKRLNQIFTDQEQLDNVIKYLDRWNEASDFFSSRGVTHKLGILMYGPPGTGKTSLVQAIAGHYGFTLVTLEPGIFCQATVTRLQNQGFENTFILLLEDIDYIFGKPKEEQTSEEKERSNLLLQFLDGVHSIPHAIIIATTNNYETLDAAIVREGRFDKKIFMDNINEEQAKLMIEDLNITNVPFELAQEEYPINPAALQARLFNHVFNNLDSLSNEEEKN